ncbi:MAG: hypothetical protein ACO3G4_05995 [Opitutaceae bacterium]
MIAALTRLRPAWLPLLLLCSMTLASRATTIVPPDFDGLVDRAGLVVRGEVVGRESTLITRGADRAIFTRVTFRVVEAIKGVPPPLLILEFLGGVVGELSLEVSGMPRFEPGSQEIVFVSAGPPTICPLVAMGHGRYRVLRDAQGAEFVARDNGRPLHRVEDVSLPLLAPGATPVAARPPGGRPLSPAEFAGHIRRAATRIHTP